MSKILVVGRATIDFNPLEVNMSLSESSTFKKYVGGSACNTAIGLQRLGQEVGMISKVSTDQFGKYVINYLNNEKINTTGIIEDPNYNLGLTFTEILSETESSILMYRDNVADLKLNIEEVNEELILAYDVILISGTALASEDSREAVFYILELAKLQGKRIIFDLDYRDYTWKNRKSIALAYHMVAQEAELIIGSEEEFKLMDEITRISDVEDYRQYFLNKKAKHIIIKFGKQGSKYYSQDCCYTIKIFPVKLVKSFGGGDAYASMLISGIEQNQDISETLFKATAHAAMLVNSHSCSEALATEAQINDFILNSKISKEQIIIEERNDFI